MASSRGFPAALVFFLVLTTANLGAAKALTKGVFAHYMVGNVYEDHAHQDIKDALDMNLDGFALNIGDPSQDFVRKTLNYMFDYARDNYPDFKLFISMDLWAAGSAKKGLDDFDSLLRDYIGHAAYYKGPNGFPFISTFADGGLENTTWMDWRNKWANEIYFIPDFDGSAGYYKSDPAWWEYWGGVVDGIFSWESTWPLRGSTKTSYWKNETWVREGAFSHDKAYMMAITSATSGRSRIMRPIRPDTPPRIPSPTTVSVPCCPPLSALIRLERKSWSLRLVTMRLVRCGTSPSTRALCARTPTTSSARNRMATRPPPTSSHGPSSSAPLEDPITFAATAAGKNWRRSTSRPAITSAPFPHCKKATSAWSSSTPPERLLWRHRAAAALRLPARMASITSTRRFSSLSWTHRRRRALSLLLKCTLRYLRPQPGERDCLVSSISFYSSHLRDC
ncbi:Glycoside hydrolase family 71 [Macrophomina phaseolina MS6]|uniref:Glycoside hydrolase family 71 n=1 Tax=Macrophomina phaseolina (strain MS6) TaxID=1126212 RepID=K2S7K4_MACPH|nr:Glycoside hydrolase family 71 [Macrophomina phaseolina MS6]